MQKKTEKEIEEGGLRVRYLFLLLVLSVPAMGDGLPSPESESFVAKKTEGMVWNKWETDNFVVLSIDYGHGDRLKSSVESDRDSACLSWGVEPSPLPVKCKLVCVPDAKALSELFSIKIPRCEIRRDESSAPKEIAIWVDQGRISSLRGLLLSASLHGSPAYLQRGVGLLASPGLSVEISSLSDPSFKNIFSLTHSALAGLGGEARSSYDREAAVLCLLARREFGSGAFSALAGGSRPEAVLGFPDEKSFLDTAKRYFSNLRGDVQSGRTPSSYLEP